MQAGDVVTVVLDTELKRELLQNGMMPFHDEVDLKAVVVHVHADDQHADATFSDCPAVRATGLAPFGPDTKVRSYYVGDTRPDHRGN